MYWIEYFKWIATALSITGIMANANKKIWCWPVWLVSNIFWITVFIVEFDLPTLITWVVFSVSNIYGWVQWKKDGNKNK